MGRRELVNRLSYIVKLLGASSGVSLREGVTGRESKAIVDNSNNGLVMTESDDLVARKGEKRVL